MSLFHRHKWTAWESVVSSSGQTARCEKCGDTQRQHRHEWSKWMPQEGTWSNGLRSWPTAIQVRRRQSCGYSQMEEIQP